MNKLLRILSPAVLALAAACGTRTEASPATDETSAPPAQAAEAAVAATGTVVEVKMITDDRGNYFEPAEIVAAPGDVIRFTLVSGVHNVSFPADQNASASALPEVSPYLQLAGQTHDVTVALPAGEYNFQCDPHAALGMVGKLTVQ